jgi:hypothetical protein
MPSRSESVGMMRSQWMARILIRSRLMSPRCRYCQQVFQISRYRQHQLVCRRPDCQKQRRREYHRHKLHTYAEYHQICRDCQEKWRRRNPDHPRQYRQSHPESIERNRQGQRRRDRKRYLQNLLLRNTHPITGSTLRPSVRAWARSLAPARARQSFSCLTNTVAS